MLPGSALLEECRYSNVTFTLLLERQLFLCLFKMVVADVKHMVVCTLRNAREHLVKDGPDERLYTHLLMLLVFRL